MALNLMEYYNDKPGQLGYYDGSTPILLPLWIRDATDLAFAERKIRNKSFGSIPCSKFFVVFYNLAVATSEDTPLYYNIYAAGGTDGAIYNATSYRNTYLGNG